MPPDGKKGDGEPTIRVAMRSTCNLMGSTTNAKSVTCSCRNSMSAASRLPDVPVPASENELAREDNAVREVGVCDLGVLGSAPMGVPSPPRLTPVGTEIKPGRGRELASSRVRGLACAAAPRMLRREFGLGLDLGFSLFRRAFSPRRHCVVFWSSMGDPTWNWAGDARSACRGQGN
jgi:hypothetical protein